MELYLHCLIYVLGMLFNSAQGQFYIHVIKLKSHNCVVLFLGLYEPRKPSHRRHFRKRDIEQADVQLTDAISDHKRIDKREVQEKQIVSITLGVRGLMVGSEADLKSHGLTKRDTATSTMRKSEIRSSELPLSPVYSFTILSAIIGSAIAMLLVATIVYFLAQKRTKTMQVITVAPQLLHKLQHKIKRSGLN